MRRLRQLGLYNFPFAFAFWAFVFLLFQDLDRSSFSTRGTWHVDAGRWTATFLAVLADATSGSATCTALVTATSATTAPTTGSVAATSRKSVAGTATGSIATAGSVTATSSETVTAAATGAIALASAATAAIALLPWERYFGNADRFVVDFVTGVFVFTLFDGQFAIFFREAIVAIWTLDTAVAATAVALSTAVAATISKQPTVATVAARAIAGVSGTAAVGHRRSGDKGVTTCLRCGRCGFSATGLHHHDRGRGYTTYGDSF